MPTRTRTTRPSGRVASRSTGFARSVMAGVCQRSRGPQAECDAVGSLDRIVHFRARTIFSILGILLAVGLLLYVLWVARHVLSWLLIALFLALALNPAVEWLQRHGISRRGAAAGLTYVAAIGLIVAIGALFIPTLINQVNDFVNNVPDYLDQVTKGRGRLGFLQTKYHLVDKAREQLHEGGARKLLGLSNTAVAVTKGVITAVVATVTIAFMTFFMLIEVTSLVDRVFTLIPE